ncbi:MAG: BamA/TamA family outer membrane protein [Selenomonadaceae bacterium]|nr:BamA/TamA family outer membrane protein [Selenomonadaceae bacterium]
MITEKILGLGKFACSAAIAAAAFMPNAVLAAPAEAQPTGSVEAAPAAAEPADPELAATVKAALEEENKTGKVESERTEEEKQALRDVLVFDRQGGTAPQMVPGGSSGANRVDNSGIDEFLKEGKEGIPQPADQATVSQVSDDAVSQAINRKSDGQTSQVAAAGEDRPAPKNQTVDSWVKSRPKEETVNSGLGKYVGRTIVAVDIEGISEETAGYARQAVLSRPGDIYTLASVDKDRDSIYNTGYFYDLYPTIKEIPEGVVITYHVMENPRLTSLEIVGNTVETTENLRKMIKAEEGKVLNTRELHENVQAIDAKYHDDGYILVKIGDLDINKEGKLKITINEGILEGYTVKGNKKTKDKVVLREMRQKPGEPFNAKLARRGMQRVYNLGFFEDVNMKLNPGSELNAVVLEIDVVEKRTGNFTIGVGYSSQDGIIGLLGIGDRNFRGRGDSINVTLEMSGDDSDAHGWRFMYTKPWLDRHETAITFNFYNRTYRYYDYGTDGNKIEEYMRKYGGGEITLSRPQSEYVTNYITFRNRKDSYVKHKEGKDRSGDTQWIKDNFGTTRAIILDHVTDTRDNIHNPMNGSRQSLQLEFAGFGGDFNYRKYTYDDQHYFKVGHAQVIALHAAYGWGNGHIPESNQYRIGGQNSLRGYRDDQFRGDHTFYGTLEYRFPLVKKVDFAIFTDFGGAWKNGFWPKGWHQSIGAGVGLNTPMGPVRLDYGYGSQGGRVHFSMGGTF